MNKGLDIHLVREHYQRLDDSELVRIATQDAVGLTLEAQEVVEDEIKRRNLDANIIKGVQAQNKSYTVDEIDKYCSLVRNLSCPSCGENSVMLNGTMASEVMSFILFTQYKRQLTVACPNCLDKANNNALIITIALGWWGIPWGFIRTIQSIGHNIKSKKTNHLDAPNDYLRSFVLSKVGQLETHKGNKEKLQQIIAAE